MKGNNLMTLSFKKNMDFLFVSTAIIIFVQENILERLLVFQCKSWLVRPDCVLVLIIASSQTVF